MHSKRKTQNINYMPPGNILFGECDLGGYLICTLYYLRGRGSYRRLFGGSVLSLEVTGPGFFIINSWDRGKKMVKS